MQKRCNLLYFNPRSRERSDGSGLMISRASSNFNPRSRERSDSSEASVGSMLIYFNPRSRERSDKYWSAASAFAYSISIHAPARGATL